MEGASTVKAEGLVKPGQPSKPVAIVRPMRYTTPAFTGDLGERDHGRREGRSQQAARGTDLRGDASLQMRPRRMLRPGLRVESDRHDESRQRAGPEARPTPSFAATGAAAAVHGHGLRDAGSLVPRPGVGVQALPAASGYWVLTDSPTAAVYPCLGFRPSEGSTLLFTQTPSGTFVYGVPEFFTHIAQ